jgi:NAD(P)-dependent dehydrogenase (short-subunit alcohol dehydrogenase family)
MASLSFIASQHTDIYPAIDPTKTDLSQPGKTVLITGGGRGIGRSTALRYAEAGVASIILCARTKSELGEVEQSIHNINSSIKVFKHQLDVTNDAQVAQIAGSIEKLDVLINVSVLLPCSSLYCIG